MIGKMAHTVQDDEAEGRMTKWHTLLKSEATSWSEATGTHGLCPATTVEESLPGEKSDRHILQERSDFVWCMVVLTS